MLILAECLIKSVSQSGHHFDRIDILFLSKWHIIIYRERYRKKRLKHLKPFRRLVEDGTTPPPHNWSIHLSLGLLLGWDPSI